MLREPLICAHYKLHSVEYIVFTQLVVALVYPASYRLPAFEYLRSSSLVNVLLGF